MGRSFTSKLADKLQVELPPNDGCCCSKDLLRIRRAVRQRNFIKVSSADVNSRKQVKRYPLSSCMHQYNYNTHCTQEYVCTQSCAHNHVHTMMCACRCFMCFLWHCRALTVATTSCRTCCVRAAPCDEFSAHHFILHGETPKSTATTTTKAKSAGRRQRRVSEWIDEDDGETETGL